MMKKIAVLIGLCFWFLSGMAQQNKQYSNRQQDFNEAMELYQKKKYSAAQQLFTKFMHRQSPDDAILVEDAEFYASMCALKLYNRDVNRLIEEFIYNHPENPNINQASFQLANHYFKKKRYKSALKWYEKVDKIKLDKLQISEYYFKTGFCYYAQKEYNKADKAFFEILNNNDFYSPLGKYFYSHIKYLNRQYQTALEGFEELEYHELFAKIVPFYITQIYHIQKRYDDVIAYAPEKLKSIEGDRTAEIARIIAEAYFKTGDWEKALEWMKKYEKSTDELSDTDYYQLGFAYFRKEKYNEAATYFEEVIGVEDSLTQNAAYHLAKCYLETERKPSAKTTFGIAAHNEFDKEIAEDALFNYAKLCFELDDSPFAESINSFNRFLKKYPKSVHTEDVYNYLLDAILGTKNYKRAIEVIDEIPNKTPKIYEAYQRICYFRGLEYFSNLNFTNAIIYFDKSLEYKQYNKQVKASAYYWKADALYRLKKYDKAIEVYNEFLVTSGAVSLPEYGNAYYNIGYAYFSQKNYSEANIWFRKFENHYKGQQSPLMCDAYNRIADCYFIQSQFSAALEYYQKTTQSCSKDADYAYYQKALSQGRMGNYQNKIQSLEMLKTKHPNSSYIPGAQYEIARTYMSNLEDKDLAIEHFQKFIQKYPNAPQMRTALSSLANLYYNKQAYDKSLNTYKKIVSKYPGTNESVVALEMIKNISVEMGNPDEYVNYVENENINTNITEFEKDSLVYEAANRLFIDNNIDEAIAGFEKYLNKYPNGHYALEANFYQAQCYYSKENHEKALPGYEFVIEKPNNMFSEESYLKAANICFNDETYEKAMQYYISLGEITQQKPRQKIAKLGYLRTAWLTNNYNAVITAANNISETDDFTDAEMRETNYKLAKAYYKTEQTNKALSYFTVLSKETTSYEGGESKYYVALINYETDNDSIAEETVVSFANQPSPNRYWLAKSFMLLAEIYINRTEYFQASHIVQSLLDNYIEETDGIKEEARTLQARIRKLEEQKAMQDKNMRLPQSNSPEVEQEIFEEDE